ncbi:30S ribosomal protein S6 [Terracidiphilus gabretensis]|uniref:30S ribosomal protein S6 n=1 Tax=Terracidiphilus gabretensis TaxID=1577687 RepID=UPI00071BB75A|nr:30S ribosomal protein S6 [Terracidiphilus gabretensis]
MSRVYEVMFIVRPDVVDEDVDKLIAGFEATVTNGGGAIKSVEKMGRRKLAYIVRKFNDGNYILLTVEAEGGLIAELERRLRVSEQVIKFITVRTDEEDKRIAKIKAIRGTRVKRSAEVSPAPPAAQAVPVQPVAAQPAPAEPAPVEPAPVESVPAAETAEPVQASA